MGLWLRLSEGPVHGPLFRTKPELGVLQALPQPLLIIHQSCLSKAWRKVGEDTQLWTVPPDPPVSPSWAPSLFPFLNARRDISKWAVNGEWGTLGFGEVKRQAGIRLTWLLGFHTYSKTWWKDKWQVKGPGPIPIPPQNPGPPLPGP